MREEYMRPTIRRHQSGQMNAQAHGQSAPFLSAIDGVTIEQLVRQHGSPLYVFSERTLRRSYRTTFEAFRRHYPNVQMAWSYKTNYLKAICSVFHQEGAIAEVVSDFEYEKARGLGIPGHDIIFNGPHKTHAALERAVTEGAKIQIDNMEELILLGAIAQARGKTVDVALRVYLDSGVRPVWSKFGFCAETNEAIQAIKQLRHQKYLRLVGLHTHVGTFILDPEIYRRAVNKLLDLAELASRDYGFDIEYLNLGGGFPSRNQLHYQYFPADQVVRPIDEYADAICRPIRDRWPRDRRLPKLFLESGRALVDEAGYLVTTVVATKHGQSTAFAAPTPEFYDQRKKTGHHAIRSSGAEGYLVDAGINLLYTAAWYQFNVQPTRPTTGQPEPRTIYGCLCMNIDVLRERAPLPNLKTGDHLVIHPVGAYNVTQSMQFITYRPRVVMIAEDGHVDVIREREDLQHVEAMERMPARLEIEQPTTLVRLPR